MRFLILVILAGWLAACQSKTTRFVRLTADETGIGFANTITESDSLNVLEFEYIYNGGGVGVGDFNGDSLPDVFFAGNQVSSKLYLNRGDFHFADITAKAGVSTRFWCTGVAVADINQDGRQDIYVSTIHPDRNRAVPNLLFINQGNDVNGVPQFHEMAHNAGLADSSYSTQATFLDYDRDGDLDVFLLTNALENYNRNNVTGPRNDGSARSRDKLYRNDSSTGNLHFTDVSEQAGIRHEGWGLGVVVNDINQDGWPDIYVANDFQSNDVWLINNQRGGFENKISTMLKHQSHNSMGIDIADMNNDGLNDVAVVDMLPDDNLRQKTMFASIPYDRFQMALRLGYQPQYVRNVLQLNRGTNAQASSSLPLFSDISYMAGTAATDWSWSALFADFDNDGLRDLLITNGYRKDITDLDFTSYNRNAGTFGSDENRRADLLKRIDELEPVYKPNVLFRNGGSLQFTNVASEWGLSEPSFSNGTAYADFDHDGDLDIVMNNINEPAFLFRNQTIETQADSANHHFLRIQLVGRPGNREGLGTRLAIWAGGQVHYLEHTRQRGYQSSMESVLHMGLGQARQIDSIRVLWPDGMGQSLPKLRVNQTLVIRAANARPVSATFMQPSVQPGNQQVLPFLTDVTMALGLTFQHQEDDFVDYKMQQTLLMHKHSQSGPALTVGDIDGNGLDDIYIAGAANRGGTCFLQKPGQGPGKSVFVRLDRPAKTPEETGVLLFDADGDHDLDLYTVHGSTEFGKNEAMNQDSLYLNTSVGGRVSFRSAPMALPRTTASGSCVKAADFDHDGDLDLFVGSRVVPQRFPEAPRSYLLRNDSRVGQVRFTDVTDQLAPGLSAVGMVCDALWTDIDNDTWPDLLLAGEFMPITLFKNQRGQLRSTPGQLPTGFWNSLTPGDFDHDGDTDYIVGNQGLNSRLTASAERPVSVYAADFDNNGTLDPILGYFNGNTEYPIHPRDVLTDQIPSFKQRMTSYAAYGKTKMTDLLSNEQRKKALIRQVTYCASAYLENRHGQLMMHPLPLEAQFSPVFSAVSTDINQDGKLDVLLVGNDYASEVLSGWLDAGIGVCLLGNGRGQFRSETLYQSGFLVDGDAKAIISVTLANGQRAYVTTQHNGPLRVFMKSMPGQR